MGRLLVWSLLLVSLVTRAPAGVNCDGVDDLLTTGLDMTIFMSGTTGTISAWIKPTGAATTDQTVTYHGQGIVAMDDRNMALWRTTIGGVDQLWAENYSNADTRIGSTFANNTWIHLAWVHSGGTLFFYKDGALIGSTASGDPDTTDVLEACSVPSGLGALPYAGQLATLTFYPEALSANQIATLGQSRMVNPAITAAPSGQWFLDQCADGAPAHGIAFRDSSGNGRSLTADRGANASGMTCQASTWLSYQGGPQ